MLIYSPRQRPTLAMRQAVGDTPIKMLSAPSVYVRSGSDATGGEVQENVLKGIPCRMGYPYEIGWGDSEVIFPGAFKAALPRFRKEGTILRDHNWRELPIAYPTLIEERVEEDKSILYAEATYHSSEAAQAARGVAADRLASGLMVGLSIGFFLDSDGAMWFKDGKTLLAFAKANGYDLGLFDQKAINATEGWVLAVTAISHLAEYSQCSVLQANDEAFATEARSLASVAREAAPTPVNDFLPVGTPPREDAEAEAKRLREEATQLRNARLREITLRATMALAP